MIEQCPLISNRFRGFLPVIIDVETGGFNAKTDALLEVAAVIVKMNEQGYLQPGKEISFQVAPFLGANIELSALEFTGIEPFAPERKAVAEADCLKEIFKAIRQELKYQECTRAVLVGHNATFDLSFINEATARNGIKRNPFHPFSCFDTATLAGLAFGHTVLAKACQLAGIEFSNQSAHSAAYDARKTAELFCCIVNQWKQLGGWPLSSAND
ncbi:ribonuclease T [Endozoicomonas sp. SM1973]|uniref:Ribonuclease T n=1 Tax=Spartinivicinus marinus TaxID=2994442 RepID=A0A853I5R2_9GAMM|nr:ribonuclease T [Spartinivicinus marinus]MCX4028689.1 ribonuclease T [Spartinivicinus marinus]NYZ68049.1 ribonuclease T [Spartinivicinus marinus]